MNTPSEPFQIIYIYLIGIRTIKDGMAMALFAMDAYDQFAFDPLITGQPQTDHELHDNIKQIFDNIYKTYDPVIHSQATTFITNLPEETKPFIMNIIKDKHQVVFDEAETKRAVQPMIKSFEGHFR